MAILVTGGAGYIGSHTVRRLLDASLEVVVVDTLESGNAKAVSGAPLVVASAEDHKTVARTIEEYAVDAIIHFAGYKRAGESMTAPGKYFRNNVGATNRLLEVATACGVDKVVFSSSCSVYGTPGAVPVDESMPCCPESPYGASKLMAEQMLRWYCSTKDLRFVSLRYFNAAGAAADGTMGEDWRFSDNLVPMTLKAILQPESPLRLFGDDYPTPDGTAIRDYVHVDDLAEGHLLALQYLLHGGAPEFVNLGTGRGASVREVIAAAESTSGAKVPVEVHARRPGDPVALFADNHRARSVLGWVPQRGLDEIVATAWRWHSTHPSGYE